MNEPLNISAQEKTVTDKSFYQSSNLKNIPLRLTEEQITNPTSVLDDFFQCYHLHNVRQILWQWLTEVLSSPRDSANDPHQRNNNMFFYEKIESLVEAAWIMRRGINPKTKLASETPNQPTVHQTPIHLKYPSFPVSPNHYALLKKQPRSQLR